MRDSRTASRMKYLEVMRANPEPLTLWEWRLRMRMPDTGNNKPRKPVRPTPDVLRRQPTTSLQITTTWTTTPVTRTTRNLTGNIQQRPTTIPETSLWIHYQNQLVQQVRIKWQVDPTGKTMLDGQQPLPFLWERPALSHWL
jgi:hypothetical protein